MKKLIFSLISTVILGGVIGINAIINPIQTAKEETKQSTNEIINVDQVDEEEKSVNLENDVEEKENNDTENSESKQVQTDSTKEQKQVSSSSKSSSSTKTQTNNNQNKSNEQTTSSGNQTTTQNNNSNIATSSNNSQSSTTQKNNVSTTFYDSITHGKKEFSSESEAWARGTEIQNKELDYVLNWNEKNPDNPIQPDINYFRVYPSAIDENGNYWYYLHFFCVSGEGQDNYLKSKF